MYTRSKFYWLLNILEFLISKFTFLKMHKLLLASHLEIQIFLKVSFYFIFRTESFLQQLNKCFRTARQKLK